MAASDDTDPVISPYQGLEDRAFWRSGVVEADAYPPHDIYKPKFVIPRDLPIFTAGSCFAQHVGRTLRHNGYDVIDAEPAPAKLPDALAQRHGYRLYAARFGNIYTVRQFLQLMFECFGEHTPTDAVWEKDGRYFDAMRPGVTPRGHASVDDVHAARALHLAAVRQAVQKTGLVVFTFGLTESWEHIPSGTIYPTAPGTIAGQFDANIHRFVNFRADAIKADFMALRALFQTINKDVRFLLTVSPVPLTATASGTHVLPATVYSKSVLRTVAGELAEDHDDIDYFPSYEIVSSHPSAGKFFEDNMRSVHPRGVRRVMNAFLTAQDAAAGLTPRQIRRARRDAKLAQAEAAANTTTDTTSQDVICEEELLEAFRK